MVEFCALGTAKGMNVFMESIYKVKQLFSNLSEGKGNEKYTVKNVNNYDRFIYELNIKSIQGCKVNTTLKSDKWLIISKKCSKYYKVFYKLSEEIKKRNDLQIMWGHTMIVWKNKSQVIMHPVFVTPMEIKFDSSYSEIILKPCGNTRFDAELFDDSDAGDMQKIIKLKEEFESGGIDPRKIERVEETIYKLLHIINKFDNNMEIQKNILHMKNMTVSDIVPSEYPAAYDIPVIFSEENKAAVLKNSVSEINKGIDKGCIIPEIIKAIVNDDECSFKKSKVQFFEMQSEPDEKKIFQSLKENYGVIIENRDIQVKNKIIYNLICELLFCNKKILIAQSTQNSKESNILNMIPEDIRPLCISISQNDSVNSIKSRIRAISKNILKADEYKNRIENIRDEIELHQKRKAELRDIIKKCRCEQNQKVIEIARWVKENKYRYGYIEDIIPPDAKSPITEGEMDRLLYLLKRTSKNDFYRINEAGVILDKLPPCEQICSQVSAFKTFAENYDKYKENVSKFNIPPENKCRYDRLLAVLEEAGGQLVSIEGSYLEKVMKEYYSDSSKEEKIRNLTSTYHMGITKIKAITKELSGHEITLPQIIDESRFERDFDFVYDEFCKKDSISRIFKFIHKKCLYITEECKVDGESLSTFEDMALIKLFFERNEICRELSALWNDTMKEFTVDRINSDFEAVISLQDSIDKIDIIINWDQMYTDKIRVMLSSIDIPEGISWKKSRDIDYMINCIRDIKFMNQYEELKAYIDVFKKYIMKYKSMLPLYNAIDELNTDKIRDFYIDAERLRSIKPRVYEADCILKKISEVCPIFAQKLIAEDRNKAANKYVRWNTAWKWSQWNNRLHDIFETDIDKLEIELQEEEKKEKVLSSSILSQKVWYNTAFQNCKGERNLISLCIVPVHKVIEYAGIMRDPFDVVIIDEDAAFQAFEVCALMKAEKAVIIGDLQGTMFENFNNKALPEDNSELKRNIT